MRRNASFLLPFRRIRDTVRPDATRRWKNETVSSTPMSALWDNIPTRSALLLNTPKAVFDNDRCKAGDICRHFGNIRGSGTSRAAGAPGCRRMRSTARTSFRARSGARVHRGGPREAERDRGGQSYRPPNKKVSAYQQNETKPLAEVVRHQSRTSRVIYGWRKDRRFSSAEDRPRVLPLRGKGSFAELVRSWGKQERSKPVLTELLYHGMVAIVDDRRVQLLTSQPVGRFDPQDIVELGHSASVLIEALRRQLEQPEGLVGQYFRHIRNPQIEAQRCGGPDQGPRETGRIISEFAGNVRGRPECDGAGGGRAAAR